MLTLYKLTVRLGFVIYSLVVAFGVLAQELDYDNVKALRVTNLASNSSSALVWDTQNAGSQAVLSEWALTEVVHWPVESVKAVEMDMSLDWKYESIQIRLNRSGLRFRHEF
ncbi:MAG: hypothetical protein KUG75_03760 [Pseudomonadales bacterium]|nr:hypothetical protein [Pseudomonadales bacterium]